MATYGNFYAQQPPYAAAGPSYRYAPSSPYHSRVDVVTAVAASHPSYDFYGSSYGSSSAHQQQQREAAIAAYSRPPTLREWFDAVDTDRSGAIDAHELVNALRRGRINVSLTGAARLIALVDDRGARQVTFEQFKALHPFIDAMARGFKRRDLSGDGYLQIDEVAAALVDSGHRLSAGCLQTLMLKFDAGRRGALSFDDYVALSVFVASVNNTFAALDRRGAGYVDMDFSQFVAACIVVK